MAEKFQKKKLNREDHKKMDDTVKNLKKGAGVLALVITVGIAVKDGSKLINTAKNIITKA